MANSYVQKLLAGKVTESVSDVVDTNPDEEVKFKQFADKYGYPVDVLRRKDPDIQKDIKIQELDLPSVARNYVRSAEFLANPEHAAIAHDDIDGLTGMESALKFGKNTYQATAGGFYQLGSSVLGAENAIVKGLSPILPNFVVNEFQSENDKLSSYADSFTPQATGNIESGIYSGLSSIIPATAAMLTGPAYAGSTIFAQGFGSAFAKAGDKLPYGEAIQYSLEQGMIEQVTEQFGMNRLFGDLASNSGILKTVGRQILPDQIGEQAATFFGDMSTWLHLNPEKSGKDFLAERPDAAAQTAIAALVGSTVTSGILATANKLQNKADASVQSAEQAGVQLQQIAATAQTLKIATRDPVAMREFVESAAEVDTVFIDANVFNQSRDKDAILQIAPELAPQLNGSLETMTEITVPMSTFVAMQSQGLGQDLVEHTRLDGEDHSIASAREFVANQGEQLNAELDVIVNNEVATDAFQADVNDIHSIVLNDLNTLGRFRPEANEHSATMVSSYYKTMSADLGVSPGELYLRYPLQISGAGLPGENLDQRNIGAFNPETLTISLLEGADLSTFQHEAAHGFFEIHLAAQKQFNNPILQQKSEKLFKWLGVEQSEYEALSFEDKRQYHEKFAEGFESYLFEGKAPSMELESTFRTFRAWLLDVYKGILGKAKNLAKTFNLKLDPDIRSVFDRMLATEHEIKIAHENAALFRMFDTPESAGMTPEEFQVYLAGDSAATNEALEKMNAVGIRDMQWLSNKKNKKLKEIQRDAKVLRSDIRAEVTEEINNTPIYRVWNSIVSGKTSKIRVKSLEAMGIPTEKFIENKLANREGIDVKVLVDAFPEYSGDTYKFINDLLGAPPPKEIIEELVDSRMLAENAEFSTPEAIDLQARAAVHNEVRGRFVTNEFNTLANLLGKQTILASVAKDYAQRLIDGVVIRNLRSSKYQRVERKSAIESIKASKKGDTEKAAAYKRNQLLNFYAAKSATEAELQIKSAIKYFKKVAKPGKITAEYHDQIVDILSKYNFTPATKRVTGYQDWARRQMEAGILPPDVTDLLTPENRALLEAELLKTDNDGTPLLNEEEDIAGFVNKLFDSQTTVDYRTLTVEQFRGLTDTVKNIEYFGRRSKEFFNGKKLRELKEVTADINDRTETVAADKNRESQFKRSPVTKWGKFKFKAINAFNNHIRVPTLATIIDGDYNGPLAQNLVYPASDISVAETIEISELRQKLVEKLKTLGGDLTSTEKPYPSIQRSLTKSQIITMALYRGNESNLQRLLGGENWTIAQLEPVFATLNAKDWKFVQDIHDLYDSFVPRANEIHRRVNGVDIKTIPAVPYRVTTPGGAVIDMRGGYAPVSFDPVANAKSEAHSNQSEAKQLLQAARNASTVNASFTKSRVKQVKNRPINTDLNQIMNGFQTVIHYIHWQEWAMDANKILNHIDQPIRDAYGSGVMKEFRSWVTDNTAGVMRTMTTAEQVFTGLSRNVSRAGLAFNFLSAGKQVTGLSNSAAIVGKRNLANSFMKYMQNPAKMLREIKQITPLMTIRGDTMIQALAEVHATVADQGKISSAYDKYAYMPMVKMQTVVDTITWHAAYQKAQTMTTDLEEARQLADRMLIDAQGSGLEIDLASVERQRGAIRLFMIFSNYLDTVLNSNIRELKSNRSAYKKAENLILINALPVAMGMMISSLLQAGDKEDDELATKFIGELIKQTFGGILGVREIAGMGAAFMGDSFNSYTGPNGTRLAKDAMDWATQVHGAFKDGEIDLATIRSTVKLAGSATGVPAAAVDKVIKGTAAISQGKTSNPAALAFGYEGKLNK